MVALLGRFIGVKDANIRYLGLEAMTRLARTYGPKKAQAHKDSVLESLRDGDISVRRYMYFRIRVYTTSEYVHVVRAREHISSSLNQSITNSK